MGRLRITLVLLLVCIMSATVIGFANPKDNKKEIKTVPVSEVQKIIEEINVEKGFINKPKDFILNTVNDVFVVSGTARENDKVVITLFTNEGEEYVQMGDSIEVKIGPLGVFTKELSLKETNQKSPKEAVVSKDTFVVLELKRGDFIMKDYRLVKFSDDKEVKRTLESFKTMTIPSVK